MLVQLVRGSVVNNLFKSYLVKALLISGATLTSGGAYYVYANNPAQTYVQEVIETPTHTPEAAVSTPEPTIEATPAPTVAPAPKIISPIPAPTQSPEDKQKICEEKISESEQRFISDTEAMERFKRDNNKESLIKSLEENAKKECGMDDNCYRAKQGEIKAEYIDKPEKSSGDASLQLRRNHGLEIIKIREEYCN